MAQTLVRLSTHAVFSTKERRNLIMPEVESDLYAYLSGILKNLGSPCIEVNGTANHLHVLFLQSKNLALCDILKEMKKSTSNWIKTRGARFRNFAWQQGYAAFSVSPSCEERVRRYIRRQKEHHKTISFEDELIWLLQRHGVSFDTRYLWS
ncbi:MAG TPA: IS200/IS605 family transposase [Acidobacteriota bacterium]|jgi:REP element-mobilizing transposase RayT